MIQLFLRLILGRELTWEELDANFTILRDALNNKTDVGHEHEIEDVNGLETALDNKISTSEKGNANGVATLNNEGVIPISQLPNFTVQAVPTGNYIWFKGMGNADLENIENGDWRLIVDMSSGNFNRENYFNGNWEMVAADPKLL